MTETENYRSFCRGVDRTGGIVSQKYDSLSGFFTDTVLSPFNQDISFLLVGKKGSGKSYASLSIAYQCALKLAQALDGDPEEWRKYFNVQDNLAIIDPVRANLVMANTRQHQIKVFDDIGLGWSARGWQGDENRAKNDCVQISRISRQINFLSVPSSFLLDKIPRSLVSHYGETSQQYFTKGFVTLKVFQPEILHRQSKIIQPFLSMNRNKFVIYAIPAPPQFLTAEYNEIRKETTLRILADRMDTINNPTEKVAPPSKRVLNLQEDVKTYGARVHSMGAAGDSLYKIANTLGISKEKAARIRANLSTPQFNGGEDCFSC